MDSLRSALGLTDASSPDDLATIYIHSKREGYCGLCGACFTCLGGW